MRRALLFLFLAIVALGSQAQQELKQQPRLVVGIVVDQMRWDYLTRYNDRYCDDGFRRLMRDGYNCNRLLIPYLPTITAVGHASIYTGSVPAFTGIVSNWMRIDGQWTGAVSDPNVKPVGTTRADGQASPRHLLVTTITDELRLATNFRSRVVGVSIKDRGAILPAGHAANAAYWMDPKSMDVITSSYYMQELPQWVRDFNARQLGQHYLNLTTSQRQSQRGYWDLLYPEETYVQSTPMDESRRYETPIGHLLRYSPYGATYTLDMARAAIEGEQLGHNPAGVPDFLAVSISTTDMISHKVGPNSIWVEDTYLRLDRDLADFFHYLDKQVGRNNYLVFLTADHAGSHNIHFRQDHHLPADKWPTARMETELNDTLGRLFHTQERLVESLNNCNVYFSQQALRATCPQGTPMVAWQAEVQQATIQYLESLPTVGYVIPFRQIPDYVPEPLRTMVVNGYNPKRSGDLQIVPEAGVTEDFDDGHQGYDGISRGTNHAMWSPEDAHIPFILMGRGIPHAWDNETHYITDISATLAALLNIQQPSACVGHPIVGACRGK